MLTPAPSGTILGFDFGLRRIGVAVGQTVIGTATPLQTLLCVNGNPEWTVITRLIAEWCPIALVVGLPVTADQTETTFLVAVRIFIRCLETRYHLPVHTINEYLSSHEAELRLAEPHLSLPAPQSGKIRRERRASNKKSRSRYPREAIDRVAAQIILQTWLTEQAALTNSHW